MPSSSSSTSYPILITPFTYLQSPLGLLNHQNRASLNALSMISAVYRQNLPVASMPGMPPTVTYFGPANIYLPPLVVPAVPMPSNSIDTSHALAPVRKPKRKQNDDSDSSLSNSNFIASSNDPAVLNKEPIYNGNKKDDRPHGRGEWFDPTEKIKYKGDFFEGKRHGLGLLTTPEYSIDGRFVNGVPDGIIILRTRVFTITGLMEELKYVGNCRMELTDGSERYDGPLFKNMKHGYGRSDYGDLYFEGSFLHDKRQFGKMVNKVTGEILYEGIFFEDKPMSASSHCVESDHKVMGFIPNSLLVKIFFKDGDREGDIYAGQHINGKMQGRGRYYFANGDIYDGQFANDNRDGEGELLSEYGKHVGKFKNNLRHGQGVFIPENGLPERGAWSNGIKVSNGEPIINN